jgi:hypothetical protein
MVQVVALRSLSAFVATGGSATVAMLAGRQPAADKHVQPIRGINAQKLTSWRIGHDRKPIENAAPDAA